MSTLDDLRSELDAIDRSLLETAVRRNRVIERIAAAKAGGSGGLFDRDRERAVVDRFRALAADAGLAPRTARGLMAVLLESSHEIQEAALREPASAEDSVRMLIVGGAGRMGRKLAEAFSPRGHRIDVLEAGDGRDRSDAVAAADVVILAVPMADCRAVAEELGPHVRADALLCDVNSLKEEICGAMERACPGEILGLHPMFGPTVRSLRRQKVCVCPLRTGPRAEWLLGELRRMGCELIETTPAAHDRMMAVVQVLVHFSTLVMGEALRRSGVSVEESLRFTSPIYRLELAFVGRLFAQAPDLYAEIEMTNPQGSSVRRHFRDAAQRLEDVISDGDRAAFHALFDDVGDYFSAFADEAMKLSDAVVEAVVREA
ncbi:MAG: bifunctional chorismate mutase/prephenate dehydrogenase [Planctomycetes bacterium]|nr:bifunctional chorismate mutase/prephenate dehydrogenase [Planctomycetota bacterium]